MNRSKELILGFFALVFLSCEKDSLRTDRFINDDNSGPTPYYLPIPDGFPDYYIGEENLLTAEGVMLGRHLFYDPILSKNKNVSCGSCHKQENAFSDPDAKSIGTHGGETKFHSMPLFNIAWMDQFFWDGRAPTREDQALQPVKNPVEMDLTWDEAIDRLNNHPLYPAMFRAAFGEVAIDSSLVAKALVQFELTIVSSDTKFDRYQRGVEQFTTEELDGYKIFRDLGQGDCIHCHLPENVNLADNSFHNNGLDSEADVLPGLSAVTGRSLDFGKFKTPSLRNLVFTAPYMHDGRFETLEQVLEFYSTGVHDYALVDPKMEFASNGGVDLSTEQKTAVIKFLMTLTDSNLVTNPAYSDPFKN